MTGGELRGTDGLLDFENDVVRDLRELADEGEILRAPTPAATRKAPSIIAAFPPGSLPSRIMRGAPADVVFASFRTLLIFTSSR